MTEKGGPMPLMGEWSWLGDPKGPPRLGPMEGWRAGVAIGPPRPVGELKEVEFTWTEKSVEQRKEAR